MPNFIAKLLDLLLRIGLSTSILLHNFKNVDCAEINIRRVLSFLESEHIFAGKVKHLHRFLAQLCHILIDSKLLKVSVDIRWCLNRMAIQLIEINVAGAVVPLIILMLLQKVLIVAVKPGTIVYIILLGLHIVYNILIVRRRQHSLIDLQPRFDLIFQNLSQPYLRGLLSGLHALKFL